MIFSEITGGRQFFSGLSKKNKTPPQKRTPSRANPNHNRYWWYRIEDCHYAPLIFQCLSDSEWNLVDSWFQATEKKFDNPGEMSVPAISLISGLISGNGISAVVQCGHYAGYSTLLLGFLLRSMGKHNCLFSVDIDPDVTEYTNSFVKRAELGHQVKLHVGDSADASLPEKARAYFKRQTEMVIIDSSHQYEHTLRELDLWYPSLPVGGLIVMHDVSKFAQSFDSTNKGGVRKALEDWTKTNGVPYLGLNSFVTNQRPDDLVYRDGCGIAIIQRS